MDLYLENNGVAPVLQTERLILRPFRAEDAEPITTALSDASVAGWLTVVPQPYLLEDAQTYLRIVADGSDRMDWAIERDRQLIGSISCKPDLGYWLATAHHGQGLMTEAARAVIGHYFSCSSQTLISGYHLGNAASARVLTKLGFRKTHLENVIRANGQRVTLQRMELSFDTWRARHG